MALHVSDAFDAETFTYINTTCTMLDTVSLAGFMKNILKPALAEALAEIGFNRKQENEKRYYTREEACKHLKIGTTTFYRLAKKGKINILKIEGKTLVDANELDEAIETRQVYRYQH